MRKIISKKNNKKIERRNQIIIGLGLVVIMLFSVLGYSFQDEEESGENINYNGFKFKTTGNLWYVEVGSFYFAFSNNPLEIDEIYSELNSLDNYYGRPLYVYSNSPEAELELYRNLNPNNNAIVQRIQPACLDLENCEGDYPIKTCSDNFIIIKEGSENRITQEENCVFIEGKKEDLVPLTDEFLFNILGVR